MTYVQGSAHGWDKVKVAKVTNVFIVPKHVGTFLQGGSRVNDPNPQQLKGHTGCDLGGRGSGLQAYCLLFGH